MLLLPYAFSTWFYLLLSVNFTIQSHFLPLILKWQWRVILSCYSHLISVPAPSLLLSASVLLPSHLHCQCLGMGNWSSLSELQAHSLLHVLRCLLHQSADWKQNPDGTWLEEAFGADKQGAPWAGGNLFSWSLERRQGEYRLISIGYVCSKGDVDTPAHLNWNKLQLILSRLSN